MSAVNVPYELLGLERKKCIYLFEEHIKTNKQRILVVILLSSHANVSICFAVDSSYS